MNSLSLASKSLQAHPLRSTLTIFAMAAAIALLSIVFTLSNAIEESFVKNSRGVDIVVGAKGSPLQLVLSSVYQADVPTGNIPYERLAQIRKHPGVKTAIPLALGDNYRGFRIVGTTPDYLQFYQAKIASGNMFVKDFEVVVGASTGLAIGTEFAGVHGLAADGDDVHHFHNYRVTGVLAPTGTVIDRLILTGYKSVQELHGHPDADDPDAAEEIKASHEITSILVKTKNPLARMNMPRDINRSSDLIAANPAYEITRFAAELGFGQNILFILGAMFVVLSAAMLLMALAANLHERRYDLAVLRVLGASPVKCASTILAEALTISIIGAVIGLIGARGINYLIIHQIDLLQGTIVPQQLFNPSMADLILIAIAILIALLAALLPIIKAAKSDMTALLSKAA